MKPVDRQFDRLLKSAASAPQPSPTAAVFALEARVLGQWRGMAWAESGEFVEAWFRRAAMCGCLLALASVAWSYHARTQPTGAEQAIARSALEMGVEQ